MATCRSVPRHRICDRNVTKKVDVKARTYLVFGLWLFIRLTENKNGGFDFRQLDALMTHPSDTTDQLIGAV